MRSFVALMTCISCIAWIHSCEKRLLGVTPDNKTNNVLSEGVPQLPVTVLPAKLPAHYISFENEMSTPSPSGTQRTKKQQVAMVSRHKTDSALYSRALVRGQYMLELNTNTP
ncbi:hypothetical protein ACDQ55_04485 [Chitinophaga sp. 30R24]|uniref:hypothetical protein n=1 Tax=Chitinophaga sp. 30R24 TaxID=3248838 RepID=UPI003B8FB50A